MPADLVVLPYHRAIVAHLVARSPAAWKHFGSDVMEASFAEKERLELLKTTYALSRTGHAAVYAMADEVAAALDVGVPVALYQGSSGALNAGLLYLPDTAAVIFEGPALDLLAPDELRALLAHELAHHRLWAMDDGIYLRATRVLRALLGGNPQRSVLNSLRLYTLCTELFADRAAISAGCERDAVVRCLVKMATGIREVVASDFLDQSRAVWEAAGDGTAEWDHPEAHIRALSLDWTVSDGEDAEDRIFALVEGRVALQDLDLLRREALSAWTRRLVDWLLQPAWLQSDAVLGHARLMFEDHAVGDPPDPEAMRRELARYGETVHDYAVFVLLDFAAVDPTLGEGAFARAHAVAEALGLRDRLEREANKKLKLTKKSLREMVGRRDLVLAQADAQVSG